jgi:hypothetical protein
VVFILGALIMLTLDYFDGLLCCCTSSELEQTSGIRLDKVIDIRRRLRAGNYNLDEHLDEAVDKLLEDILVQNPKIQADFSGAKKDKE